VIAAEPLAARIARLELLLDRLDAPGAEGASAGHGPALGLRLAMDLATELCSGLSTDPGAHDADAFRALARARVLEPGLGERLARAARQRDRQAAVPPTLLGDLRAFAAAAAGRGRP